jgi:flagellar protein FlaJ
MAVKRKKEERPRWKEEDVWTITLEMPLGRYLLMAGVPAIVMGIMASLSLIYVLPGLFGSGGGYYAAWICPVMFFAMVLIYPYFIYHQRRGLIDREMHLFITRVGTISVSRISRKGIFDILAQMKEYGELAVEINKIHNLVNNWNMSLADACRQVGRSTPSQMFSDFLDRLAHAVETGEDPKIFFRNEQKVVMDAYEANYFTVEKALDVIEEMFISLVVAVMFIVVIVSILPMITGASSYYWLSAAVVLFIVVELLFLFLFSNIVPRESVWHQTGIPTEPQRIIRNRFLTATIASMGVFFTLLAFSDLSPVPMSLPLAAALTATPFAFPLIGPGPYILREEAVIKRRDDNFAAFMRSLGSASESKTSTIVDSLDRLRKHNFGPLTDNIEDLYKRSAMRIDLSRSWRHFGAETGSDLISKFGDMYVEGFRLGANPKEVTNIISDNFGRMVMLRRRRYQHGQILTGLLYGIAFAVSLVLFMTMRIVSRVLGMVEDIGFSESSPAYDDLTILQPEGFSVFILMLLFFTIVVVHIIISAVITRIVGAGHKGGAVMHVVGMLWMSAITFYGVNVIMDAML